MRRAGRGRRSRRWSPAEARRVLVELERSGQPATRFAAARGLGVERLYRWQGRLGGSPERASASPRFAEVTVRPSVGAAIEVVLPGGALVRLSGASRVEDAVSILSRLEKR
jgi:hypothetical protein